jgi:hypothetical protein
MKTKTLIATIIVSSFCILHSAFAQGSLTPPGAPAPTMKTLSQIEARTPISTAPFTITQPGSYYLTTNVTVSGGANTNAIFIAASQVTLDLNGFTISSSSPTAKGAGIMIGSAHTNIAIFNGSIAGGVTESGGVFSGSGFDSGINFIIDTNNTNTYGVPYNVRVSNVSVSGCLNYGIFLYLQSTLVDSCTVQTVGSYGIVASLVRNSTAMDCGNVAIDCNQASHCQGQCVAAGWGIYAGYSADNCSGSSVGEDGIHTQLAQNCSGSGVASGYQGIYADVAQNCYGSSVNGTGLFASTSAINCDGYGFTAGLVGGETAENCYGRANTNGVGLLAHNANNCAGYCPAGNSGYGLSADLANNCFGQHDGNGIGLYATSVAIGCEGRCYGNNFGISASILNSCTYYRQTGTPGYAGTKYNMP